MFLYSYLPLAVAAFLLMITFQRRDFALSYVTLAVATTSYFMLPGLMAIEQLDRFSTTTIIVACTYICICLIAIHIGWNRPLRSVTAWVGTGRYSEKQLSLYILGGLAFGGYFSYALTKVSQDLLDQTAWSGRHTIYYFLSQPAWLTLAPATLLVVRKQNAFTLGLFALSFSINVPMKVIGGRRDEIIEVALICVMVWETILKRYTPRSFLFAAGILVAVWFSFIGEFRKASKEEGIIGGFSAVFNSTQEEAKTPASKGDLLRYNEVVNFLVAVDQQLIDGLPNLGAVYWNGIVHQFVPAQIVGLGLKESLKFRYAGFHRIKVIERGLPSILGTTQTGFSCTFTSFLCFGCLVFYFAARLMSGLYYELQNGNDVAWCLYSNLMIAGAVGITHSMSWFINSLVTVTLFQVIWFRLMKRKSTQFAQPRMRMQYHHAAQPLNMYR